VAPKDSCSQRCVSVEAAAGDEVGTTTGDFYAAVLRDADGSGGELLGLDEPATKSPTAARDPARGPRRSLRPAKRGGEKEPDNFGVSMNAGVV